MVIGVDEMGLNPTPDLMESPMCSERLFLEDYTPATTSYQFDNLVNRQQANPFESNYLKTGLKQQPSWKTKHPEQWTDDEVKLWICSLMSSSGGMPINLAPYLNLTGAQLVSLSCADFQLKDIQSGMFVYMALQSALMSQMPNFGQLPVSTLPSFTKPEPTAPLNTYIDTMSDTTKACNSISKTLTNLDQSTKGTAMSLDLLSQRFTSMDLKLISFDVDYLFDSIRSLTDTTNMADQQGLRRATLKPLKAPSTENEPPSTPYPYINTQHLPNVTPLSSPSSDGGQTPPYSGSEIRLQTRDELANMSQYGFSDVKGNHLWEFIRDLLFDSRYNPSLVKWEDREEGIFKFVKSDQVAKLWGRKKNNPAMTYEKLSRAMRYYYRRRILERIDGRRLVYKFGPMATGWQV